ncbi:uncharacterized protein LOC126835169 isoform X2 [Adelges cooleyi]|uniref:uncharacterized protein LOC126835169 isoform X2 n=1 Tax=Adelges cooleyi TaxID=133065 RepID=UPI0021801828|nr:uncharacterized protein LOC126835169 isoform X2 [Adelges cooleyi]
MKLLRLLILFGLISVLVACDRKEYYSVVINTSRQMESLDEEQMDKVMLAFAKKKYPIVKMQVQRQLQKLIEDATDIEAPDVAKDLYGPNCKLSEYEAIRKRLVTSDLIRKLIKTEMDKDETSLRHIRYFSEVPYTCRLIAMSKTLKNPNNIIVEDNIIKVGDIHICQLKDSEGNLIRYRSVTGTIWRDNPDGTNIDVTLDSELD